MQKTALIALALIGTLTAGFFLLKSHKTEANTSELKNIYNQWKVQYNINVGAAEDDYRFDVFSSNYAKIQEHNRLLGRSYTLGLNAFSHLTAEEFSATHLGLKGSKSTRKVTVLPTSSIPASVDWRSKMNAVQDQGQCGSCWAFSATASFEALNAIKFGDMTKHAEQDLVDCAGDYGNNGCDGGLMDYAFEYMIANGGLATEADYPYTASDGTCDTSVKRSGIIKSYTDVEQNSAAALKAAIAQQPVSVAIEADTSIFQSYSSGIITSTSCGTELDHGVVAVGYDTTGRTPYYIVRNSWGASWGQQGYVNIAIVDGEGICGIQMDPSYPTA